MLHTAALFHRCIRRKLHRSPTIVVPGREACRCHPCRDLVIPVAAFQRPPPPFELLSAASSSTKHRRAGIKRDGLGCGARFLGFL